MMETADVEQAICITITANRPGFAGDCIRCAIDEQEPAFNGSE